MLQSVTTTHRLQRHQSSPWANDSKVGKTIRPSIRHRTATRCLLASETHILTWGRLQPTTSHSETREVSGHMRKTGKSKQDIGVSINACFAIIHRRVSLWHGQDAGPGSLQPINTRLVQISSSAGTRNTAAKATAQTGSCLHMMSKGGVLFQYTMRPRCEQPGDKTQKPGPDAHKHEDCPHTAYSMKKSGPSFSFGRRHHEYSVTPVFADCEDTS